jgi:hypothetical protein
VLYGDGEAYILPRGTGERLPWNFRIDTNIGYVKELNKGLRLSITMNIYNVGNFQSVIARDNNYTFDDVTPLKGGTMDQLKMLKNTDGNPVTPNPNFGKPIAYQTPRQFSFGIRLTF